MGGVLIFERSFGGGFLVRLLFEACSSDERGDERGGDTYLLVSFLIVSSLSLELPFYVERRNDASFASAVDPNDWFIQRY